MAPPVQGLPGTARGLRGHAHPGRNPPHAPPSRPSQSQATARPITFKTGSKIANIRNVAGIVFPTSPLAATTEELQQLAGSWPDIEKSRAEAWRLLKEAGAEGISFELLNRNVDQPYKYVGTWIIDEWRKIGLNVSQRMMPTGPWTDAMRRGEFAVVLQANWRGVPNPLLDVQPYLPSSVLRRITAITRTRRSSSCTTGCCARLISRSSAR